ncbi:acetyl-CoA acetyltransferase [Paenarthrobacter sp. TE4293]|uniref:thiolase family protein n=1 Tax=Paenarthrobacter sp. TE4293 TaxID=3381695 RepID=UPI003D1AA0F9
MGQKRTAIAGLGLSDIGKVYSYSATEFAAIAVRNAVADAGISLGDVDGLIMSGGLSQGLGLNLQGALGVTDLNLLTHMQGYGSTAAQMVQYASMAVQSGMAETIAIVWADDPLKENRGGSAAYKSASEGSTGWRGLLASSGIYSANTYYALAARRHMRKYGTTSDHLGAIAVAQRKWAMMNPLAQLRTPLTLEDYHASRYISEPFHLFDCCLVSNGGIALVITSLERARLLPQPPVEVLGWAQAHPGRTGVRNDDFGLTSGAATAGPAALKMADTSLDEIDLVEVYDCYSYTALVTLEDYGFCDKGEGGPFLAQPGVLGPGGSLAVNTGGGQLSSYYLWGMTPLSEAVIQARGQAGERQVSRHDRVLVSGNGGTLDHHATLVLGTV